MAGIAEFRNEKFIQQYEHITKLQLLTDEELSLVKRKRSFFEVSVRSSNEIKPFIDYIKFEIALMKKFRQMDLEKEADGRALDRVMSGNVKDLFKLTLKKFQDKRKIWEHYLAFVKQKFPNSVTSIYREMLHYHHKAEDYIEAAEHEMSKGNFTLAMSLLVEGIGSRKESSGKLVVMYIECSLQQGAEQDEKVRQTILVQASKFYEKFLKHSGDVKVLCELLNKIQSYDYSMGFQNAILSEIMEQYKEHPEVWELFASRHLDGIFYEPPTEAAAKEGDENKPAEEKEKMVIPFDVRLRFALATYEKALDSVDESSKKKMFTFFIKKLLALDERRDINNYCLKITRQSLGKTLMRGFEEGQLSEGHFICLLKLRMLDMEKNGQRVEEMIMNGRELYPSSMDLFEMTIKFYQETNHNEGITEAFNYAINNNEDNAVDLYKFLCEIYLKNSDGSGKIRSAMLEAVNSTNKKLSESFQPYFIEYLALTDSIEKAREAFRSLLTTRTHGSLSLDFFKMMIKLEEDQATPNDKLIFNCYERATEHFGKANYEVGKCSILIYFSL